MTISKMNSPISNALTKESNKNMLARLKIFVTSLKMLLTPFPQKSKLTLPLDQLMKSNFTSFVTMLCRLNLKSRKSAFLRTNFQMSKNVSALSKMISKISHKKWKIRSYLFNNKKIVTIGRELRHLSFTRSFRKWRTSMIYRVRNTSMLMRLWLRRKEFWRKRRNLQRRDEELSSTVNLFLLLKHLKLTLNTWLQPKLPKLTNTYLNLTLKTWVLHQSDKIFPLSNISDNLKLKINLKCYPKSNTLTLLSKDTSSHKAKCPFI